jgi:hypothetical protein
MNEHAFDFGPFDFFAYDVDRPEPPIRAEPDNLQKLRSDGLGILDGQPVLEQ